MGNGELIEHTCTITKISRDQETYIGALDS